MFRNFLYGKWFFLFLAVVILVDLAADVGEEFFGPTGLNELSIALDIVAAGLVIWIFADLHSRRPKSGGDTGRG